MDPSLPVMISCRFRDVCRKAFTLPITRVYLLKSIFGQYKIANEAFSDSNCSSELMVYKYSLNLNISNLKKRGDDIAFSKNESYSCTSAG